MPTNRAFAEFFFYAWPFVFFSRSDFLAQKIRLEFQRSRNPHISGGVEKMEANQNATENVQQQHADGQVNSQAQTVQDIVGEAVNQPTAEEQQKEQLLQVLRETRIRTDTEVPPEEYALEVDGKGIQKLRAAGVEVVVGVLEKECQDLNRRFFTSVNLKRPYVILKWAQSIDGYIDKDCKPVRISNHQTEILNHKWRSEEDAILVGYNTALRDNPSLTNRLWAGKNPLRVVLDRDGSLPKNLKIFDDSARTVVLDFHGDDMPHNVLSALNEMKVQSLIIEGGASTHRRFIKAGLWDEARIFVADVMLGGGTKAAEIRGGRLVDTEDVGGDRLLRYVRV